MSEETTLSEQTRPLKLSSFLSLPGELRNLIYQFYFSSLQDPWPPLKDLFTELPKESSRIRFHQECTNLYRANHQVYVEARSYFFEYFMPGMEFYLGDQATLVRLLELVPIEYRGAIKGRIFWDSQNDANADFDIEEIADLIAKALSYDTVEDLSCAHPTWYSVGEHDWLESKHLRIPRRALDWPWNEDEHEKSGHDAKIESKPGEIGLLAEWVWKDWYSADDDPWGYISIEGDLGKLKTLKHISKAVHHIEQHSPDMMTDLDWL
jgi:hypothetical protein